MFKPDVIYYEKNIEEYPLGKDLLKKFNKTPKVIIENHNKIDELRSKPNTEFANLKKHLIIGVRKTHKYTPNKKVSDYLVPYTSSGCTAMCMYCYLVCNFNKCSYLRLFVNREQMLDKMIKTASKSEKPLTFEIGSNSDIILENTITNNLSWTIENFANSNNGFITFPTKFDMVDDILDVKGIEKIIPRVSINPQKIINMVEFGTSRLDKRIEAINKLKSSGYKVGILIAPIILVENWQELYNDLFEYLAQNLSNEVKECVFFELIFMTYSYIHKMINTDMFPNAIDLFDEKLMTARGPGKYTYKSTVREDASKFFVEKLKFYFPNAEILYIS